MRQALLIYTFSAILAEDAVVHNPFNRIVRKSDAEQNLKTGLIHYEMLERTIEWYPRPAAKQEKSSIGRFGSRLGRRDRDLHLAASQDEPHLRRTSSQLILQLPAAP